MTETPTDDQPGFVAEKPEHCHACYRLIEPGQTYCLTIGQAIWATLRKGDCPSFVFLLYLEHTAPLYITLPVVATRGTDAPCLT